ncbi:MAG TPA: hypothetical protein VIZ68_04030 [Thermoplasmata archaeon]
MFEFGNSTTRSLGFAYDWIAYPSPTAGNLTITVVQPTSNQILSGYPQFNPWPFGYFAPVMIDPNCCTTPNTFTVHVAYNGAPVYNALVTAAVATDSVLAWQGSRIQSATQSLGNPHELSPTTLSWTYTSLTGDAVVYTWNVIKATPYFVNATYGGVRASTTYQLTPGPNVKTYDNAGGKYSQFSTVSFVLQNLRQIDNPQTENLWAPNSINQSGFYNIIYAWQGQVLPVSTNDWTGAAMPGTSVWLGSMDFGGENKFYSYQPSFGVVGVTNTSGTSNITDPTGNATVFIPDNMTDNNFFTYPDGSTAGFAYLAASMPGQFNRTFSYTEPCPPTIPGNPKQLISCQFNDTYQRNYSAVPVLILGDPVNVTTQTTSKVARDFFGSGGNISVHVNVHLPNNDPFVTGYGYNWEPGLEHVVSVEAFVDGIPACNLSPAYLPQWQNYTIDGNLTGNYQPGIHDLKIVTTDSLGHVFTRDHTFVVGAINVTDLSIQNTYTVMPFNLTWTYVIPPGQMNNHTFSQSLEIRYVASGCGGTKKCPQVVNYTIKVRPGVVDYYQSLNITLLNLQRFYAGASELPPGQYQIILWLNANHSGSIAAEVNTQLVFEPVSGSINGPVGGAIVPLGNVTISYGYSGQYIQNATLKVFPAGGTSGDPVFSVYAFVPGLSGLRGGAATWSAVTPGDYQIVLSLGTPYTTYNVSSNVTVSATSGTVFLNQSHASGALGGMNPAALGTVLAIIAAIIGLLLGLFLAPALRGDPARGGPKPPAGVAGGPAQPWQEDQKPGAGKLRCSVCQEEFSTDFALHQHLKVSHGIEE